VKISRLRELTGQMASALSIYTEEAIQL
jgi:hypothetical protein